MGSPSHIAASCKILRWGRRNEMIVKPVFPASSKITVHVYVEILQIVTMRLDLVDSDGSLCRQETG